MELNEELKADVGASAKKENGTQPEAEAEKSMHCTSNLEDHSFDVEDSINYRCGGDSLGRKEFLEVNIVDCTDISDHELEVVSECNDGTDGYSSSFGGTACEPETGTAMNGQEVDSPMFTATPLPSRLRKKRLTDHWRRFIRPIMWRCKWLELRMKWFQAQAQNYDKELREYYQAKQSELENLSSERLGAKSLPFSCQTQTNRVMKRKKRKRVEETTDVPSYMSNHNLFSYYEYRKSFADGAFLNDNSHNLVCGSTDNRTKNAKDMLVFDEEPPSLGMREGDEYLEQILLRIEAVKSEAHNLKNRVDKVLSELPQRFSSGNALSLPGSAEALTSTHQKPLLPLENEDEKPVKSLSVSFQPNIPEDNTRDILMPENAVSSQAEGKHIPDKMTPNMEQSSIEGPSGNARKRRSHNREAKEDVTQRPRVSKERPKTNTPTSKFKIPKRKRKRGKRRSGSAGIRRKS